MNHTNCEFSDSMLTNCKNDMWTEITNICRLKSECYKCESVNWHKAGL